MTGSWGRQQTRQDQRVEWLEERKTLELAMLNVVMDEKE
jgi:hypothetical protein